MTKQEIRFECLSEIFEELGIVATQEQIKKVVEDFSLHIEMEGEMESHRHFGHKEKCAECERLKDKLKSEEEKVSIYHKSVCERRKTEDVWIENGTAMYK
jgi:hypothetical protein